MNYLDSIRAIAALTVVYFHGAMKLAPISSPIDRSIFDFFTNKIDIGKAGVIVFFMVSGFIIPVSLKANKPRGIALRNFLIGRLFRLYPIYWLSLMAALYFSAPTGPHFKNSTVIANLTMFQGFVGIKNMMGLYWTLQIEWMFYIVCIVLFILVSLTRPNRILITQLLFLGLSFAIAILRYTVHKPYPVAAFLGLSVMFTATLWRMFIVDGRSEAKPKCYLAISALAISIPAIACLGYHNTEAGENWVTYTITYWAAITFFLLATSRMKMSWRPLAAVGRASFSLYLGNDYFRLILDRPVFQNALRPISSNLFILAEAIVAVACSLLLYKFFEEPAIAMGRRLIRALDDRNATHSEKVATEFV